MATHDVFPGADPEVKVFMAAVMENDVAGVEEILKTDIGLVSKQVTYKKFDNKSGIHGYSALLLATGRKCQRSVIFIYTVTSSLSAYF